MSLGMFDFSRLERSFIRKEGTSQEIGRDWLSSEKRIFQAISNANLPAFQCLEAQQTLHAFLRLQFVELKSAEISEAVDFRKFYSPLLESFTFGETLLEDSLVVSKILKLGLKSIQLLLGNNISLENVDIGQLLGTLKHLASFGLPGFSSEVPESLKPSQLEQLELNEIDVAAESVKSVTATKRTKRSRGGKKKSKPAKKENHKETKPDTRFWSEEPAEVTTWQATKKWLSGFEPTSESELSDTENMKPKEMEAVVRRESLDGLKMAFKLLSREVLTSFWWSFMPGRKGNLVELLLEEPNCKVRFSAAVALEAFFRPCKVFLAVAEERKGSMAFTPFAIELGESLVEIHQQLIAAAKKESSPITLIQIFNTINTLTALTPFRRFPTAGLVTSLVSDLKGFLVPNDRSLPIGVLTILGTIIRCHPNVRELEDLLSTSSWIVTHCFTRIEAATLAEKEGKAKASSCVAEAIQCLLVLNELCKHYPKHLLGPRNANWARLESLLVSGMAASQVQLHVAKLVPTVATVLLLGKNLTDGQPEAWDVVDNEQQEKFWVQLLSGPLPNLCQKLDLACLRAAACDCLAAISDTVLESLPPKMRLMCLSLLVGQAFDDLPTARASAIRALGIYVLLPSLMEDENFVLDVCNAVKAGLNCESHPVRVNSAWALGNVTDAFVAISEKGDSGLGDHMENIVPLPVFRNLLKEAIDGTEEKHNFKVRHSAVRSIGGLIKAIPKAWAEEESITTLADSGVHRLVDRALGDKDMKARWNACYAISCALSNHRLDSNNLLKPWCRLVAARLQPLIADFKNLKVRIRAAAAILAITDREAFGDGYVPLWEALTKGLENVKNLSEFSEYQHVHGVVEQYCRTLAHLATLATLEDLQALAPLLSSNCDILEENVHQAGSRLPPGKADFLLETARFLVQLKEERNKELNSCQKESVDLLLRVFGADGPS